MDYFDIPETQWELVEHASNGTIPESYKKISDFDVMSSKITLYYRNKIDAKGNNRNLNEYFIKGTLNVPRDDFLFLVMDESMRAAWDTTLLSSRTLVKEPEYDLGFYVSKYPFPLLRRTYLTARTFFTKNDIGVIFSRAIEGAVPFKISWSTRVTDYISSVSIRPLSDNTSEMYFYHYEDPKTFLPDAMLNRVIVTIIPTIISKLLNACRPTTPQERETVYKIFKFGTDCNKFKDIPLEKRSIKYVNYDLPDKLEMLECSDKDDLSDN